MLFGGIVTDGIVFSVAIGNKHGEIIEQKDYSVRELDEVKVNVFEFFRDKGLDKIGISYSEILKEDESETYAYLSTSHIEKWETNPVLKHLKEQMKIPLIVNTKSNGSALAEALFGQYKGLKNCLYMTVDQGISIGALINGKPFQGLLFPRMSHFYPRRYNEDHFDGLCPFHKDCLEGLASKKAIEMRWSKKIYDLIGDTKIWDMEAYYLSQGLMHFILTFTPEKIFIDGSVMEQGELFDLVRKKTEAMINGFVEYSALEDMSQFIIPPTLNNENSLLSAIALCI